MALAGKAPPPKLSQRQAQKRSMIEIKFNQTLSWSFGAGVSPSAAMWQLFLLI